MSCPSLSSMEKGLIEAATLPVSELQPAHLGMGGREARSQIRREGWLFTGTRLWMHARVFTYVPQMNSGKEVPSPESFLIRTASARSCQWILVVPLLSCDSLVMVT